ncbi:MAG: hypothetical protein R3Y53_09650 [Bacillota bacterium]
MNRTIYATIRKEERGYYQTLKLQTSHEEIQDAFDRLDIKDENYLLDSFKFIAVPDLHMSHECVQKEDIYELNFLAERLEKLDYIDKMAFGGVVELEKIDSVKGMHNVIENIEQLQNISAIPCMSEEEIGEFLIDCELSDEVKAIRDNPNLSDEMKDWIVKHIDAKQLGEEVHKKYGGEFIGSGYVFLDEKLKDLYRGDFEKVMPKSYVFQLEIHVAELGTEFQKVPHFQIELPMQREKCEAITSNFERMKDGCSVHTKFDASVLQLNHVLRTVDQETILQLNELALQLDSIQGTENMKVYKVLLENQGDIGIDTAVDTLNLVDKFQLESSCLSAYAYGNQVMETLKNEVEFPWEQLNGIMNVTEFGQRLIEEKQGFISEYGVLLSKTGQTLEQEMATLESQREQDQAEQDQAEEQGMMM